MKRLSGLSKAGDHGAAMVEFAVLMLVFVPLILLPMFFQDALRFKLDAQEAVYSSVWDFAYGDYMAEKIGDLSGEIQDRNNEIFEDGWSGSDKEPIGPWASFEWAEDKITCTGDKNFGATYPGLASVFHMAFTKGGLVDCKGHIKIQNDYIPGLFLEESGGNGFATVDHFSLKKGDQIEVREAKMGLLVDSWSITVPDNTVTWFAFPISGWQFDLRAGLCFVVPETYQDMKDAWDDFASDMEDKELSAGKNKLQGFLGDNPILPDLRSVHPADEQFYPVLLYKYEFYVTPYKDGDDDMYEETFKARDLGDGEAYYLGCSSFKPNC